MAKIIIIGGGVAGCTSALELSKKGHEIVILERAKKILCGTSAKTPGRMGLGYHYFDLETAKLYMKNTIEFMKHYPDCFLGDKDDFYLKNGRYFITKNSLVPLQEVMSAYDKLSLYFEEMCKKDSSNNIFETCHLHRAMSLDEFRGEVNIKKVQFGIQTKESLLDWQKFESRLKEEIKNFGIEIKTDFEVEDVCIGSERRFLLLGKNNEKEDADYVINCSWQNIDKINSKLILANKITEKKYPSKVITSMLKLLAEVKLPKSLIKKHSMFFCFGPHAMFSNIGNGFGRITYAPVTNFGVTTESEMPEIFEKWLNDGLSKEEQIHYGQKIIDGVAEYIPDMRKAELKEVVAGIVRTNDSFDLTDKNSPFHKRNYDGVEERQIGWIDNAAMKLFYCLNNAKKVAKIVSNQEFKALTKNTDCSLNSRLTSKPSREG